MLSWSDLTISLEQSTCAEDISQEGLCSSEIFAWSSKALSMMSCVIEHGRSDLPMWAGDISGVQKPIITHWPYFSHIYSRTAHISSLATRAGCIHPKLFCHPCTQAAVSTSLGGRGHDVCL